MKMDFSEYCIHLVVCPVDMRCGFRSLAILAQTCLGIDVTQEHDCVIFVSSRRNICKMIWSDAEGNSTLTRKLHKGGFQKILVREDEGDAVAIGREDLLSYLDGGTIQREKRRFF